MTLADDFYNDYLKPKGILSFTHRDILIQTETNCPYSLLKDGIKPLLDKLGYKLTEKQETRINAKGQKKNYKRYYIEEKG